MRRIEEIGLIRKRDGHWKRRVVEYWLWCDETTQAVCKVLKIERPLLMRWHRWYFQTRPLIYGGSPRRVTFTSPPHLPHRMKPEFSLTEPEFIESLQAQIAALESALSQSQLKTEAYQLMIDIAERDYKIDIRKKYGAKRLSYLKSDIQK